MNICTIFSPNWIKYFLIFAYSVFINHPNQSVKIYLLSDELTIQDLKNIDNICDYFGEKYEIKYINMEKMYNTFMPSGINVDGRFSKFVLYKTFMAYIISDMRILFLDGDTNVNGDLSDFFNMDMNGNWMIGCSDTGLQPNYKTSLGLNEDDLYVNGGSLLFDMHEIRKSKIADKWVSMLDSTWYALHEQDVFNITLKGKIGVIDAKYNTSLSTSLDYETDEIKVMHWAGEKAWNNKSIPFANIYYKYEKEYNEIFTSYKPNPKIPKTIAYCWFGGAEKSDLIKKCIQSWKDIMPDFEIIELNEDNTDINCNKFVSGAYKNKKYAFLNDYFRMKYMYENGGITLDADVETIQPLNQFLRHRFFTGKESDELLVCATMGAEKGHPLPRFIMDFYEMAYFDINNMQPNTSIITKLISSFIKSQKKEKILLENDVNIYNKDIFAPYDHCNRKPTPTENTYTIHHFQGSWLKNTNII